MARNFGEYMFDLLFAPLRKGAKAVNQFYIFFQVTGRAFDEVKAAFFQIREEANAASCSEDMLPIHGEDRDMVRLEGETMENYRTRLMLKGAISEMAGLNSGIRYLARAFGYDEVQIEPGAKPDHWAEATVWFVGGDIVLDDRELLLQELNKIKPARTLLHLAKEQQYQAPLSMAAVKMVGRAMTISQE